MNFKQTKFSNNKVDRSVRNKILFVKSYSFHLEKKFQIYEFLYLGFIDSWTFNPFRGHVQRK